MEVECPRCHGTGAVESGLLGFSRKTCPRCGGIGHVEKFPKYNEYGY